jgi:hypothetical protein
MDGLSPPFIYIYLGSALLRFTNDNPRRRNNMILWCFLDGWFGGICRPKMQYNCRIELAGFCVHYIKEQTYVYFLI